MRRKTFLVHFLIVSMAGASAAAQVPGEVVFPQAEWVRITPRQAGLNADKFRELLAAANVHGGGWGGNEPAAGGWGAVLTRGGYLVHTWGNPKARFQSASLGKCITRVLFGLSVEAGRLHPDEPIGKTWTGRGQLSHAHKCLDAGLHRQLTWRHLLEHQGGFVLESAHHWRTRTLFHARIPAGVTWTGDPLFDNFCQTPPGTVKRYSSGGYWRLGQALTALWDRDLKEVIDERLFSKLGIPPDRWDWLPGKYVYDTKDFYPDIPGYGQYLGPPYEINGHIVRGGPGWVVMSASDLARFGLLIATGGIWKGQRLVGRQWLRGHAGLDIHVVAGDPATKVSIAKINTKDFPFGSAVGTQGKYSFPPELVAGPVNLAQEASRPAHRVVLEKGVRIPLRDGVHLVADGSLYRRPPAADMPPDRFVYDPDNPVPTLGGQMSTHAEIWGPKDRRPCQQRQDVLVLPVGTSAKRQRAQQTVYHDSRHASYLLLPVVPR